MRTGAARKTLERERALEVLQCIFVLATAHPYAISLLVSV
jgi:hypothetical protein